MTSIQALKTRLSHLGLKLEVIDGTNVRYYDFYCSVVYCENPTTLSHKAARKRGSPNCKNVNPHVTNYKTKSTQTPISYLQSYQQSRRHSV